MVALTKKRWLRRFPTANASGICKELKLRGSMPKRSAAHKT